MSTTSLSQFGSPAAAVAYLLAFCLTAALSMGGIVWVYGGLCERLVDECSANDFVYGAALRTFLGETALALAGVEAGMALLVRYS